MSVAPVLPTDTLISDPISQGDVPTMRLSQVLEALAREPEERVSIRSILALLSDRSFAVLIVLLGLPNCLPMPPPIPSLSALMLILVASQMGLRRAEPWFPRPVLRGSVAQADLRRAVVRALPVVSVLERWSKPRWHLFGARTSAFLSALLLIVMAVGMLTAAPLIGQVPYGLAVCLIGLGQAERDGMLVASGVLAGLLGAMLSAGFIYGVFLAVRNLF